MGVSDILAVADVVTDSAEDETKDVGHELVEGPPVTLAYVERGAVSPDDLTTSGSGARIDVVPGRPPPLTEAVRRVAAIVAASDTTS